MPSFWNDLVYSLKAMGPLVHVLRLVDNEKQPAMDRAKKTMIKDGNANFVNHCMQLVIPLIISFTMVTQVLNLLWSRKC